MTRPIVVGGGLAGLSAAHTVLERVRSTLPLDNKPSLGGHPAKSTSSINGARTQAQHMFAIVDGAQVYTGTTASARPDLARPNLITALTPNSASTITWLTDAFNVDLSFASCLGEHTIPRTHHDSTSLLGNHARADEETHGARWASDTRGDCVW
ncbi:hypothetical protein C8R45DRAFT_913127 [Mycena sanguinolenta]|nr:hypothetical protein C8R45DRAFT_913127 [Mycena sanguinolenta]